jgi:hypothetical protein
VFQLFGTQCRGVKKSTYMAGLPVDPEAHEKLPTLLKGLLEQVQEQIPAGVAYRQHVEGYCNRMLKIVGEAPTQADAEDTMGRQYEELLIDVEKESVLINAMAQWQPWAAPEGHAPRLFAELKDIPTNVKAFRDFQHEMGTQP